MIDGAKNLDRIISSVINLLELKCYKISEENRELSSSLFNLALLARRYLNTELAMNL